MQEAHKKEYMGKKIVYIMNVDWDWIKQRPHFLAEHLSRLNKIIVLYPYAWRRKQLVKNDRSGITPYPLYHLPFSKRFAFIRKMNTFLVRFVARIYLAWIRPDILWVASPELFEYLPLNFSGKIIYDCMDDVLSFQKKMSHRQFLEFNERKLIEKCSQVFCSSKNLRDKLIARAGCSNKYKIIYNAFEPFSVENPLIHEKKIKNKENYVLGYIGTISSWLDFDALMKLLNLFDSIEVHLVGPVEKSEVILPQHKRMKFVGPILHKDIPARILEFDALLMPFHVTDLIQSVDPVKLYEYIFFNKPITSVRYKEIERFDSFIDFYDDHGELILIIEKYLKEGFMKKYSDSERIQFISSNTWMDRAKQIQECLVTLD